MEELHTMWGNIFICFVRKFPIFQADGNDLIRCKYVHGARTIYGVCITFLFNYLYMYMHNLWCTHNFYIYVNSVYFYVLIYFLIFSLVRVQNAHVCA
jgi:hypothetical protein